MILYHSTKKGFTDDIFAGKIADEIDSAFYTHLGRHTTPNEYTSWKNSMMYMNNVINTKDIPDDSEIAIEYQIPLTSKRIDFIISGLNSQQKEQVIIIELKQWEYARLTAKDGIVRTRFQRGEEDTTHPSYQAWSYARTLYDYNETVREKNITLIPCAYLHNYKPDNIITNSFYQKYINKAPTFLRPDAAKLREFIKKYIKYGSDGNLLYFIEKGKLKPSKQLADSISSMLKGNQEFTLLDDQKIVYETALAISTQIQKNKKKHVLIIEGGPGSGKSVIAVNLLAEFIQRKLLCKYISKNAAPREVYATKLAGELNKSKITSLFGGSGNFFDIPPDTFDVLIVDEAHRLNYKSGLYQNKGKNQVIEIINASKMSIFFVDDNQRIHINDIGTKKSITNWAYECNAIVYPILTLTSQFRCNGSEGYLSWLENTLQLRETANIRLSNKDFDFQIFNDPNELRKEIEKKNRINNKSRIVAGYCWNWKSKKDPTCYDIEIPGFNFKMKWNLDKDGSTWIIAPDSINQIGCIHTCQGLDLDYVGVIIGNDLRCDNGRIITDVTQRSSMDKSVRGLKTMLKRDKENALNIADQIIKNTYRTLMTRGLKGCYIYCCDEKLALHLQNHLESAPSVAQKTVVSKYHSGVRIEPEVNDDVKYIDFLPLYSIKAACGTFGEGEAVDTLGWIKVEGVGRLNRNMFVIKAAGHSMEPQINDGDYCIFRTNVVGSRNGKTVLVQHYNYYDSDNAGSYSIKKYTSQKMIDPDTGEWKHEKIILEPKNKNYQPIILEENDEGFMVIGEFIDVVTK